MNNREFETKQEMLNLILEDWNVGKQRRAFEKLCWFCNGLLASIKELEDSLLDVSSQEKSSVSPKERLP